MKKYKLVKKTVKEIEEAIDVIQILLNDPNMGTEIERIEWKKSIQNLKNDLDDYDDDRWFLMDTDDKIIIVDFRKEYFADDVEEDGNYITVTFTDGNNNELISLLDYQGNEIVSECIDYRIENEEYVVSKYGYQIGNYMENDVFEKIEGTEIIGYKINYQPDKQIFIVDDLRCYDTTLNYLGRNLNDEKIEESEYLKFKNDDEMIGLAFKGTVILNPAFLHMKIIKKNDYLFIQGSYDKLNKEVVVVKDGCILKNIPIKEGFDLDSYIKKFFN